MLSTILMFVGFCAFLATVVGVTLMITLAMPQSKMRDVCLQCAGWGLAGLCALYVVSPVDCFPVAFLPIDDFAAAVVGIVSAMQAYQAASRQKAGTHIAA